MRVYTEIGFEFSTSWGDFKIGDKVILSNDAKDNENYSDYFDSILIITWVDLDDEGMGEIEPIMSFTLEDGSDFPYSLHGYEIEGV